MARIPGEEFRRDDDDDAADNRRKVRQQQGFGCIVASSFRIVPNYTRSDGEYGVNSMYQYNNGLRVGWDGHEKVKQSPVFKSIRVNIC